ncbi:hypothetical protein ACOMHN_019558 [Nucella lapillus]
MAETHVSSESTEQNPSETTETNDDHLYSAQERHSLFSVLQGAVTDEQLEAWSRMTAQTHGLVQHSSHSEPHSDMLTVEVVTAPPAADGSGEPAESTFDPIRSILGPEAEGHEKGAGFEAVIDSALGLEDAAKRVSALSQLNEDSRLEEEDFSTVAMNNPEVLATYLTGNLTFGEFYKAVRSARKSREEERQSRKRKADGEFVYEDDDDDDDDETLEDGGEEEEEEETEDATWTPDVESQSAMEHSPRKKPRKPRRLKWALPKHLQGLMGEVNRQMANANYEQAMEMCLELIRRAPSASDPYITLVMLYDEKGLMQKGTEVLYICAHLKRTDSDLWVQVSDRFLAQNDPRKAAMCLTQAVRHTDSREALELMERKCGLYEEMGDMQRALMGYVQMLTLIGPGSDHDEQYLALARRLCETYHNMKRITDAARVLTTMFKTRPSLVNSDDVNKLLDLRLTMNQYQACLEGLVDYCGVKVTMSEGHQWTQANPLLADIDLKATPQAIASVAVPADLPEGFPLDLLTKLCCCLIHLGFHLQAKHLVSLLLKESVDEDGNGERFLDVVDAFMDMDLFDQALVVMRRCVQSRNFSQAAVWLRYGDCLSAIGQLGEAVEAFSKVVELAPNHLGARVSLSALQQQIGRHDEALQVLSGTSGGDSSRVSLEDQTLLLHKCHLLLSQKRHTEFIATSRRLLFHYFRDSHMVGYSKIVFGYRSAKHRKDALKNYMEGRAVHGTPSADADKDSDSRKDKGSESKDSSVGCDDLWDVYIKLCNVLLEENKMDELAEVTLLGLTCPAFTSNPVKNKDAEFLCLNVCMMTKRGHYAYNFIKEMCMKDPENIQAWNLFNQSLIYSCDIRHHRFCLRRLIQWPDHLALGILNGHNSVQNGGYRCALGEYMSVFQRIPTDPLINLCIGLCYFHLSCQKFTSRKDWLILEGIAFMNTYLDLRGKCQEAYYNLGRAMQQLDLAYAAVYYYKKALSLPPVIEDKDGTFDLSREIAFNLSLIYRKSGNMDLARLCIEKYIVV